MEFGEYALDTVYREFEEEIGQALTDVRLAGVLENMLHLVTNSGAAVAASAVRSSKRRR